MTVGARLRAAREARGLTLDDLARTVRVQPRILDAIERDEVAALPPRPFGRGFVSACARELGLDPVETSRAYFGQFLPPPEPPAEPAAPPPRRSSRLSPAALGTLALVAALAVAGRSALRDQPVRSAGPAPVPLGTSGTKAMPHGIDADLAPPPAAQPASFEPPAPAAAAPAGQPLSIVLTATVRPAWVAARADGERVLFQTLQPGASATVSASRAIALRVGDAGALEWRINGGAPRAMGRSGQVRELTVTPANAERIR